MPSGQVAPGRARTSAAARAGFRPRGRWLPRGGALLGLGLATLAVGPEASTLWANALEASARGEPAAVLQPTLVALAVVLVSVVGGALFGLVLSGEVRPIERGHALSDAPRATHTRVGPALALALFTLATGALLYALGPVVAGASRSVAASEAALVELWFAWLRRWLLAGASVVVVAGVVERVGAGRRLWRALFLDARRHRELAGRR